jgi:hypothetical protein
VMLGECSAGMSVFRLFDWSTMSFETFGMHGASAERICTCLDRCKDLHLHGFAKCMCLKKADGYGKESAACTACLAERMHT